MGKFPSSINTIQGAGAFCHGNSEHSGYHPQMHKTGGCTNKCIQFGGMDVIGGWAAPVFGDPAQHGLLPRAEPQQVRRHDHAQVPRPDRARADAGEAAAHDRVHPATVEGGGERPRGRTG